MLSRVPLGASPGCDGRARILRTEDTDDSSKEGEMYRRIVVPLDGSDIAELAIPEAERMARLTSAPLHLIRVVDPRQVPWYGAYAEPMGANAAQEAFGDEEIVANGYLAAVAKRIDELDIEVESEVRRGRAANELVAAGKPDDLIVIA